MEITAATKIRLENEFTHLEEVAIPDAEIRVAEGQAVGDITENTDVRLALADLAQLRGRATQLRELLRTARVVEKVDESRVGPGLLVELEFDGDDVETFLFGTVEDKHDRFSVLSDQSPIGQAIAGCQVGDVVTAAIGGGVKVRIVSLRVDEGLLDA